MRSLWLILEKLPFAVSWATLPGAHIHYANSVFDELFGYPPDHFSTADEFINACYVHERERAALRTAWNDFTVQDHAPPVVIPETEIDIVRADGEFRTVVHWGIMIPEDRIGVALFKDVSPFKRAHDELRTAALRDPLTGAANRRALEEYWRQETARDHQKSLALVLVDLDDFKAVNDTYGHLVGDEVLAAVVRRLKTAVRSTDLVFRLGGDEFGILLTCPMGQSQRETVCQRIATSLSIPIPAAGKELRITASVGGCQYPDEACNLREVMQRADRAMYHVKETGKAGWRWWQPAGVA